MPLDPGRLEGYRSLTTAPPAFTPGRPRAIVGTPRRFGCDGGQSLIPQLTAQGLLPVGRFQCTQAEVQAAFVAAPPFAASTTRSDVWARIEALLAEVSALRVRMPAAFLAGSFTTSVLNPADGDLSPIIDASRIQSDTTRRALATVIREAKRTLDLDVIPIFWTPVAIGTAAALSSDRVAQVYASERGRWDDFWQRHVPKAQRSPFQRDHAHPKRGYLEVIVDGYN